MAHPLFRIMLWTNVHYLPFDCSGAPIPSIILNWGPYTYLSETTISCVSDSCRAARSDRQSVINRELSASWSVAEGIIVLNERTREHPTVAWPMRLALRFLKEILDNGLGAKMSYSYSKSTICSHSTTMTHIFDCPSGCHFPF